MENKENNLRHIRPTKGARQLDENQLRLIAEKMERDLVANGAAKNKSVAENFIEEIIEWR